jgi:surface antigen
MTTMWKKKALALVTAAAMAGSAISPVLAQGYNDRSNDPYNNQYNGPANDGPYGNPPPPPNNYGPPPNNYGPPPSNYGPGNAQYNDNAQYNNDRDQYERDRARYDADRAAAARWDRDAFYRDCERQRSGNTAGGAIIGALAGGLLGNSVSRGPQRGAGTAVGAILGGVVGASIGKNLDCEDRSYAVDASYRGFEAGRPHQRYDWRSPRGDSYGYVQVGDYYQDRGRRCTTYTQEIWVHGRPETARGRACRMPDGTWQMIS